MPRPMPRLFLIRHGETEWSLNGRHTGTTDILLTKRGLRETEQRALQLVGDGLVLDPKNIVHAYISPRQRALVTFDILFKHVKKPPCHVTDEVREWDYGDYEGLTSPEIDKLNPGWSIWEDGCPGGESAQEMEARVDRVITKVRTLHKEYLEEGKGARDVVIVAHGHFNRCLISRWINFKLCLGTHFNVEPAGIAILSYNHHNLAEPALNAMNLYAHVC